MTAINCIVAHFAEKSYKKSLHDTENFTVLPIICFWYGRQTVAKNGQRIFSTGRYNDHDFLWL